MAELILVEELQDYLVTAGVGQLPSEDPSLTVPSIWLQPRDGAPEPRRESESEGAAFSEDATITLVDTMLGPPQALEAWIEEAFVDIVVRSRKASTGKLIHRAIRGLIHPNDAHGGRKMWEMNNLLVEYSTIWTSEQPVVADEFTFTRKAGYRFGCRRKVLAGEPYGTP
jgi:hypothetical protein